MSFNLRNILTGLCALLLLAGAGRASAQLTKDECLGCHGDATADKPVDAKKFDASIHGSLSCTDCHADIKAYPHEPAPAHVACANCHPDAQTAWEASRHGKAIASGSNKQAATCLACHGKPHEILPSSDPNSRTFHKNIPATCASCHGQKLVMEQSGITTQPLFSYQQSVHGRAVASGSNAKAAVCTDCHGHHEILGANEEKSTIFKFNVPKTCGKCHGPIAAQYAQSIHGKAIARGNDKAPVCTDCHGIHNIKRHIDPQSSVAAQNIAKAACGQCHGNVVMTREFGISPWRVQSYEQSYHGLAKRLGSETAANCASCHGVHNILPASDPKSTIHKANLPATCGKCHPGAGAKFAVGRVHLNEQPVNPDQPAERETGDTVLRWIKAIYVPLIALTLGGMALHNLIIWYRKVQRARKNPERKIVRMNRHQRIQHFLLLTSFFALVVTGFALAYPESVFGSATGGEMIRRTIHRVAAVIMMALGLYHIGYMTLTKEGRTGLKDFWFRLKDARDVIGVMKYYLGLSHEHPKMGRFTYAEKAEYWALVWGTIVMGVTGLMLWFEVQVSSWLHLQRWWIDVALAIHFYEAILATFAIIIWHFYAVMFDPDIYPLNWAWFDGKMTEQHFHHEHGEAYEEMKRQQTTELPGKD